MIVRCFDLSANYVAFNPLRGLFPQLLAPDREERTLAATVQADVIPLIAPRRCHHRLMLSAFGTLGVGTEGSAAHRSCS